MTQDALRVLGVAYRVERILYELQGDVKAVNWNTTWSLWALLGMIDPARTEVKLALEKGGEAGIRTVMITGDYPNTARAIAGRLVSCAAAIKCHRRRVG